MAVEYGSTLSALFGECSVMVARGKSETLTSGVGKAMPMRWFDSTLRP